MKDKSTDTKKETIGSRFRELRENYNDRGMTQETCADLLQISLALYGRVENDRAVPSTAVLIAAANLFGVSVDYLLCRTDFRTGAGGEYISKYTGLNDKTILQLHKTHTYEWRNHSDEYDEPHKVIDGINLIFSRKAAGLLHDVYDYVTAKVVMPELVDFFDSDGTGHRIPATGLYRQYLLHQISLQLDKMAEKKQP